MWERQAVNLLEVIEDFGNRVANRFSAVRDPLPDACRHDLCFELRANVAKSFSVEIKEGRDISRSSPRDVFHLVYGFAIDFFGAAEVQLRLLFIRRQERP